MCTHNIIVLSKNKEKYHNFLSENYHIAAVKNHSILHRRVIIMFMKICGYLHR